MRQRRITIKDIAHHLGLSTATVSLSLNDAPGVNEETRQRVKEYARCVRYRPDASARAISTGRTYLVASVLDRITESFFDKIAQGIEDEAYRHGYAVIVHTSHPDAASEPDFIERLVSRHVDGVISIQYGLPDSELRRLYEVGTPVVQLRPEPGGTCPSVSVDNRMGGRIAARHLLSLGHRRILFLGDDLAFSNLRAEGANEVFAPHGAHMVRGYVESALNEEAAYYEMCRRLRDRPDFTAIFCADDVLCVGAIRALNDAGLNVPVDVSVIGFDDLFWTRLLTPPLTTIHQPQVSQGETAMRMLVELMEGRSVDSRILEPRLVVRGSTGPAKTKGNRA